MDRVILHDSDVVYNAEYVMGLGFRIVVREGGIWSSRKSKLAGPGGLRITYSSGTERKAPGLMLRNPTV